MEEIQPHHIDSHYVATGERLAAAKDFKRFDGRLSVHYDHYASQFLKGDYYEVTESFKYYIDDSATKWVYVPKGFLTDGASVPRPFWWLIPPMGKYAQAAVVHDILCERGIAYKEEVGFHVDRDEANKIFYHAMEVLGVPKIQRKLMYWAVKAYNIVGWTSDAAKAKQARKVSLEALRGYH